MQVERNRWNLTSATCRFKPQVKVKLIDVHKFALLCSRIWNYSDKIHWHYNKLKTGREAGIHTSLNVSRSKNNMKNKAHSTNLDVSFVPLLLVFAVCIILQHNIYNSYLHLHPESFYINTHYMRNNRERRINKPCLKKFKV